MSQFRKLTKKQDAVVNKILDSGILTDTDVKDFLSIIKKRSTEKRCEQQDLKLAEYMYEQLKFIAPKLKRPNLNRWGTKMYAIRVTDRIGYNVLYELIGKVYRDDFWKTKILNPDNLRRHAQRLILQFSISIIEPDVKPADMFEPTIDDVVIDYGAYNKYREADS